MAGHVLIRSPADLALAAPPSAPTPRPHLTATLGRAHRKPDAVRALRARARPGSRRRHGSSQSKRTAAVLENIIGVSSTPGGHLDMSQPR